MEKLFETIIGKISRYEIITNLIPGTLLLFILALIGFDILFDNVVLNIISSYYVGLVNNRFSSLYVESIMRKLKWLEWRDYDKYNKAKAARPFIATLQETANQFRAFTAVFLLALLAVAYHFIQSVWPFAQKYGYIVILFLLFLLFLFSYMKQVNDYVVLNIDEVNLPEDSSH